MPSSSLHSVPSLSDPSIPSSARSSPSTSIHQRRLARVPDANSDNHHRTSRPCASSFFLPLVLPFFLPFSFLFSLSLSHLSLPGTQELSRRAMDAKAEPPCSSLESSEPSRYWSPPRRPGPKCLPAPIPGPRRRAKSMPHAEALLPPARCCVRCVDPMPGLCIARVEPGSSLRSGGGSQPHRQPASRTTTTRDKSLVPPLLARFSSAKSRSR